MVTLPVLLELPSRTEKQLRNWTALGTPGPLDMERLLLLPLLWAGEWVMGRVGPRLALGLQLSLCVPPGSLEKESLYQLQVQGSVTVQEGLCVSVPCNVSYPQLGWAKSTHVYGAWFRKEDRLHEDVLVATDNSARGGKKKRNISFHLLGDPRANNCSLGIAEARKRDSGNYYFQLIREAAEHSYKNNQLTVNVIGMEGSPGTEVREGGKDGPCPSISEGSGRQWPTVRSGWAHTGSPSGSGLSISPLQHEHGPPMSTSRSPWSPAPAATSNAPCLRPVTGPRPPPSPGPGLPSDPWDWTPRRTITPRRSCSPPARRITGRASPVG